MIIKKFVQYIKRKTMSKAQFAEYLRKQGVKIGQGCDIDKNAYFDSEPWLISIGDNTRITRGVQFITHDGGIWTLRNLGLIGKEDVKYGFIKIGKNCNISWNVTIMPNVTIGNNVVIAAGAVVTKNVPDNTVWGGIPAKQIETIDEYSQKIQDDLVPTFSMSTEQKYEYLKAHKPDLFL